MQPHNQPIQRDAAILATTSFARIPTMRSIILLVLLAACMIANAQDAKRPKPSNLQSLPEAPPPPAITSDPSLEPEVTITQKDGAKVEEYRIRGKLYAMKV